MWYLLRRRKTYYVLLLVIAAVGFLVYAFRDTISAHQWQIISAIPGPIRRAGRVTLRGVRDLPYLRYRFAAHDLPLYDLRIQPDDLAFLNENLPDSEGFISEAGNKYKQEVPAELAYQGKTHNVKVRYRGEKKSHWLWPKKSWRIDFGSNLFEGKRHLNLIIPLDRQYLAEQFNNYRAKKLGLVVSESRFVVLRLNGESPAIYWEVEQFDKEFVEKAGLSSDTHIYGEAGILQPIYRDIKYWQTFLTRTARAQDDYGPLAALIDLINTDDDALFQQEIFSLVDKENFYAWNIQALLSASNRSDWAQNIRLYWNPALGKLQFFPWDVGIESGWIESDALVLHQSSNPLVNRILSYPEFLYERNARLWEYVKDKDQLDGDLAVYDELFEQTRVAFYQDRIRRFHNKYFDNEVNHLRDAIERQFLHLRDLFTSANARAVLRQTDADTELEVAFSNTAAPVYIDSVEFQFVNGATSTPFDVFAGERRICTSVDESRDKAKRRVTAPCERFELRPRFEYATISVEGTPEGDHQVVRPGEARQVLSIRHNDKIDVANIEKVKVVLKNGFTNDRIPGVREQIVDKRGLDSRQTSRTAPEFAAVNSSFRVDKNELVLPAGVYTFDADVVVPRNTALIILPGTVINLVNGASLVSYSPVIARGTKKAPIVVRAQTNGAGGNVVVLDNEATSIFEYIHFSGGGAGQVNGALFTGMLAVHHADSLIRYSTFENARGDDALNIKYASSTVAFNLFQNNSADAIDYDYSTGVIEHNQFVNNGNDGIDISGSPVLLRHNRIFGSGDKCISIGEESAVVVFNNVLDGCHIGVEVKDLSTAKIVNNVIINNDIGINAYQKKEIFGGGQGQIFNSIIWHNGETIAFDKVSTIEVSYSAVEGGYSGEGNFEEKPAFAKDFTNDADRVSMKYRNGGDTGAIKKFLGIEIGASPVGLLQGGL